MKHSISNTLLWIFSVPASKKSLFHRLYAKSPSLIANSFGHFQIQLNAGCSKKVVVFLNVLAVMIISVMKMSCYWSSESEPAIEVLQQSITSPWEDSRILRFFNGLPFSIDYLNLSFFFLLLFN